jgi:hypothetical protein
MELLIRIVDFVVNGQGIRLEYTCKLQCRGMCDVRLTKDTRSPEQRLVLPAIPLGTEQFNQDLEKATQRRIALQKRGPREKIVTDRRQGELTFDP